MTGAARVLDRPVARVAPWRRRGLRRAVTFYLLISPWLIGFVLLAAIPLVMAFLMSLSNYDGLNLEYVQFVGLENYTSLLTGQQTFLIRALWVTAIFSLVVTVVIVIMLNGYAGTQIEATFGERKYDALGRGEFVLALVVFPIVSFILFTNEWAANRFGGATIAEWMSITLLAFALLGLMQRVVLAWRLERS